MPLKEAAFNSVKGSKQMAKCCFLCPLTPKTTAARCGRGPSDRVGPSVFLKLKASWQKCRGGVKAD